MTRHSPTVDALLRAARVHPAIATPRVLATTTGSLYLTGGLMVLVAAFAGTPVSAHPDQIGMLGSVATLIGVLVLLWGRHLPYPVYHGLVANGTAIITALVLLSAHRADAMAFAAIYTFVAIDCFFFFAWPVAVLQMALAQAASAVALHHAAVSPAQMLIQQGTSAVVALVICWLVRATAVAEQDPLTGVLNRRGFDRAVAGAVEDADRDGSPLSVVLIDLDGFKEVNDALGHAGGDRLLRDCAAAWAPRLRPGQRLARYGGDEFVLILPGCGVERAGVLADELRAHSPAGAPFSAGVAQWQGGEPASMLVGQADLALYEAKRTGRNRTARRVLEDPESAAELLAAIADGQLVLHFQPIVDLATETVIGAEALVRWQHPTRGLVPPDQFIAQAERDGTIHALGRWVLEQACTQAARWAGDPGAPQRISVNASGLELLCPNYVGTVREVLRRTGLRPQALVLEVTESTLDADRGEVAQGLKELRELGIRVAIDDFGTGYSSLSRLDRLPADILKIDRSFVARIPDSGDAPILEAIILLAAALDLQVVAEGIETARQSDVLRRLGCQYAQGYRYGKPAPVGSGPWAPDAAGAAAAETAVETAAETTAARV